MNGHVTHLRSTDDAGAVESKVLGPPIYARVVEAYKRAVPGMDSGDIEPFVQIAV